MCLYPSFQDVIFGRYRRLLGSQNLVQASPKYLLLWVAPTDTDLYMMYPTHASFVFFPIKRFFQAMSSVICDSCNSVNLWVHRVSCQMQYFSMVLPTELQATTTLGILGQTRAPWAVLDSNMPIWIFRPVRKCTMEDLFFLPCVLWVGGACLTSQLAFLVSVLEDFLTVSTWVPRLLRTLFVFSRFWLCKHIVFRSGLFELPVPGTTMARGGSWFLFSLAQTWANEGRMQPRQERLQGEGQGVRTSEFSQKG